MRKFILVFGLVLLELHAQVPAMLGLGDSIGEGVQSADASWRTQPFSYLNLFARQANVSFPLPLISSSPFGVVGDATLRFRLNPSVRAANLAFSGADINSVLDRRFQLPVNSEADLVLRPYPGSQVETAESLRPPLVLCWIGSSDVLSAVTSFSNLNASQMTPVPVFEARFAELARRLTAWGGKVIFGNIPDVTRIGFVADPADVQRLLGSDFGLPEGSLTSAAAVLLIRIGLADGSILLDPNYVLDPAEVATIRQTIAQFNQIIASHAAASGMPVVDINGLFNNFASNPPTIAGITVRRNFPGGLFSLDGVHPSNIAQAIITNAFISAGNTRFAMNIPPISAQGLASILLEDPFVDKDRDGKVRGRPLAGLLETLAPLLGISGDLNDSVPDVNLSGIDTSRTRNFVQLYSAVTGRSWFAPWDRKASIEAFQRLFHLRQ